MHRRSVSCLSGITPTNSATLSRTSQRHASNASSIHKPSRGKRLSRATYDRVELTSKGLVAAAAKKQNKAGWGHPQHYEGETRRLTEAVKSAASPHKIPTPELQTLLASQDLSFDPLTAGSISKKFRLQPGSFVEIRRSESVHHGVVVQSIPETGVWKTYTLLSGGELWPHQDGDVMFYIPEFVDRDLIARCGSKQATLLGEKEIAARVTVLKRLRNFEIAAEQRLKEMYHQLRGLYDQLRHPDHSKATTVSVERAARFLTESPQIPVLTRLAVHKYLFDKPKYFTAEVSNFLAKPSFTVRSKQDVETIDAVDEMVMRRDPVIDGFVEKAKVLIRAARKRERDTWSKPPTYQVDDSITFTPAEMAILRCFRIALRNNRTTQKDPFLASQTYITKRIGLYETEDFGPRLAHPLLVELGVMPPWVDPVERVYPSAEENDGLVLLGSRLTRNEPSSYSASTSVTRPASSLPLGPEDFYSRDPVDHLRHDFGNMPVYVIDDFDAEELDDGISVERIPSEPEHAWLHVHVADPTSVLPPTHRIALEALGRMESLYFLDRSIPMLPNVPQLRDLSLGKIAEQRVMTFSGKVDQEGNLVDYKIRPGIIRNAQKLRYRDVSEAIGSPLKPIRFPFGGGEGLFPPADASSVGESAVDDIRFAQTITNALFKARIRRGAMEYNWPSAKVGIHPRHLPEVPPITNRPYRWSGFPRLSFSVEETQMQEEGARQIVAESMRTASRIASLWLRDHDIPGLRRVTHEFAETVPGGLQRLMEARDENGFVDHFLMRRLGVIFSGAAYELTPGPHAVLGIPDGEGYMRTTSPLRRFLDIVTHWQIKHAMLTPDTPRLFPTEWLQRFADHATWWEARQRNADRNRATYWSHMYLQRWLAEHKEGSPEVEQFKQSLVAVVTNSPVNNFYYQYWQTACQIWDLGLKGSIIRLEPTTALSVGDRVPVKIESIQLGTTSSMSFVRR